MTGRDRMFLIVVSVLAVLAAAWLLVVAPEREKASKLGTQVAAAQAQLLTAEGQVASARGAQSQYAAAYASIVKLGKAVPASQEVPSLIYELSQATHQKNVDFTSIVSGDLPLRSDPALGGARYVLGLHLVGDASIRALNAEHRGQDDEVHDQRRGRDADARERDGEGRVAG